MERYDVIIIGGGPAGLSAGIYTARANKRTLILDKPGGSTLLKVEEIENYFGFPDGITGKELLELGRKQAEKFGAVIVEEEAVAIKPGDEAYVVETPASEYEGRGIIIATGVKRERANIKGLKEFEGRGVSYCVTCDGFFFRGARVGVLGSGDYAAKEALELLSYTKDVCIFTNGEKLTASQKLQQELEANGISVVEDRVEELLGGDTLEGVKLEDGSVREVKGLFVAVGTSGAVDFARSLGIMTEGSAIVVDSRQSTGVPRVYAAGDCTGGNRQVAVAVGEGANAALNLLGELRKAKSG